MVAGSDSNAKRLKKIYASESAALQAAEAEWGRTRRAGAKLTLPLSWGRPDIFPEKPITVTGFKPEINAEKWIVVSARHQMDGTGGSTTTLNLETV